MAKKSKTPSRSTPKPKTPVLLTIAETVEAAAEAMPLGSLATVGLTPKDVQAVIDYPDLLRGLLIMFAVGVFIICLVLYLLGRSDAKSKVAQEFGNAFPQYVFDPWFVVLFLIGSIGGFIFIILMMNRFSFFFTVAAILYLVSFVLLFVKLYYNVALFSSAVQVFSFILLVSIFLFGITITQDTSNFLLALLALVPSVIFAGFTLVCGGKLNP